MFSNLESIKHCAITEVLSSGFHVNHRFAVFEAFNLYSVVCYILPYTIKFINCTLYLLNQHVVLTIYISQKIKLYLSVLNHL